jgi:aquaporin Z
MYKHKMKKAHAEFTATFFLIFFGTGAIAVNEAMNGAIGHLGIALSFGVSVIILIYLFGPISGAHMNPVVSLVMWLEHRLSAIQLLHYWIAQAMGALLASVTLYLLIPDSLQLGRTRPSGSIEQTLILEVILTFFLLLSIVLPPKKDAVSHGTIIGGVVFLEALVAGPICGASMNPFRSLAPAAVTGNWEHLWVYFLAPFLGGVLAWVYLRVGITSESK